MSNSTFDEISEYATFDEISEYAATEYFNETFEQKENE